MAFIASWRSSDGMCSQWRMRLKRGTTRFWRTGRFGQEGQQAVAGDEDDAIADGIVWCAPAALTAVDKDNAVGRLPVA